MKRHDILRSCFAPPCSYIAICGKNKIVVAFHNKPNTTDILVKYWDISATNLATPLPRSQEMTMSTKEILEGRSLPPGYSIFNYLGDPSIPVALNRTNRPMQEVDFNLYYDNLLNTTNFQYSKAKCLWDAFLECYGLDMGVFKTYHMIGQMELIETRYRKYWQFWIFWKLHMLELKSEVAVELILTSSSSPG